MLLPLLLYKNECLGGDRFIAVLLVGVPMPLECSQLMLQLTSMQTHKFGLNVLYEFACLRQRVLRWRVKRPAVFITRLLVAPSAMTG